MLKSGKDPPTDGGPGCSKLKHEVSAKPKDCPATTDNGSVTVCHSPRWQDKEVRLLTETRRRVCWRERAPGRRLFPVRQQCPHAASSRRSRMTGRSRR